MDDENWERAQKLKKQRSRRAKRNTKVVYLLQHLLRCGECGHNFHAKSTWRTRKSDSTPRPHLAQLAVNAGAGSEDVVLDAVGPETFTFEEMVRLIARRVGSRARLIHVRPSVALLAARMAGWLVRDVVLTRDEIDGLMAGHLVSADPPTASTRFTEWLEAEGATLGRRYASELGRHYRRP